MKEKKRKWNKYLIGKKTRLQDYKKGVYRHLLKSDYIQALLVKESIKENSFIKLNSDDVKVFNSIIENAPKDEWAKRSVLDVLSKDVTPECVYIREILEETDDYYYIIGEVQSIQPARDIKNNLVLNKYVYKNKNLYVVKKKYQSDKFGKRILVPNLIEI